MELEYIAKFLRNRVADLKTDLNTAFDGLGPGNSTYPDKIKAALHGISSPVGAIEDIIPFLKCDDPDTVQIALPPSAKSIDEHCISLKTPEVSQNDSSAGNDSTVPCPRPDPDDDDSVVED